MRTFQATFSAWLSSQHLDDRAASKVLGTGPNTVKNYRIGRSLPPNPRIPHLAAALGIDASALMRMVLRSRAAIGMREVAS